MKISASMNIFVSHGKMTLEIYIYNSIGTQWKSAKLDVRF